MLRAWLVKISPETGSPVGSTTLVPKGRTREVIGQTIANSVTWQKSAGETTSAGRRPLCSRPTRGSKSVQMRSPASGAYGIGSLDDLASLVRAPIEGLAHRLRGHAFQQVGKDIARPSRSDDDPIALGLNVDPRTFAQTGPHRDVLGNAQPQAVAPPRNLHLHWNPSANISDIHGISLSDAQVGCGPARSGVEIERVDLAGLAHAAQRVMAERLEARAVAERGGELRRYQHLAAQRLA